MRRKRWIRAAVMLAAIPLMQCSEPLPDAPTPPTVESVEIEPAVDTLVSADQTLQLVATARDGSGNVFTGRIFQWTSSDETVATVDGKGLVTAAGANGEAAITAMTDGVSGNAAVVVVTAPAGGTVWGVGRSVKLEFPQGAVSRPIMVGIVEANGVPQDPALVGGTAFDFGPDGFTFDQPVQLSIQYDPANLPAGVSEFELVVHKLDQGAWVPLAGTTVNESSNMASAPITSFSVYALLGRIVESVEVSPTSATLAVASTQQLTAIARNDDGEEIPDAIFAWTSDDESIATVDGNGLVTAVAIGTATITAKSGQAEGTALITVNPGPSIVLSTTLHSFTATFGGGDPAAKTVAITEGGSSPTALTGLSVGIVTYTGGASGWLTTAALSAPDAPATLTLQPETGSLQPGTYVATVPIVSPVAANSPAIVSVAFTVNAQPTIALSPSSPGFSAVENGQDPAPQVVNVTDGLGGPVPLTGLSVGTVTYGPGASGWLAPPQLSGGTAPATLTLQPRTGSLTPATYTATVPVLSAAASNSPQNVTVTFTVGALVPTIALNPTAHSFTATELGTDPSPMTVAVTNAGGGSVPLTGLNVGQITYTGGASGWLTTATLDATTAPATLTLQPETGTLAPGAYMATVPVASSVASNSPQNVTVTFTVNPRPTIVLSPTSRAFTATAGGQDPGVEVVNITNGTTGPVQLTGLSVGAIAYGPGASGWLATTLNSTTAPTVLQLQPQTGALAAGTYTATVPIASAAASNSPQNVSVTFVVDPAPMIVLNPANPIFSVTENGSDPAGQTVNVTNGSGGPVPLTGLTVGTVTYTGGASGWLVTPTLNRTTAPAVLSLQPRTGSLAPATYTATVPILSGVAANSPQNVTVTFTVNPLAPTITLSPPDPSFTAVENTTDPAPQAVSIANGSGGSTPLTGLGVGTVTYGPGATNWLDTPVLSGTSEPATLTLQPRVAGLTPGTYSATVPVTSSVASNSPQNVTVTFDVTTLAPTIALDPATRTFTAIENGANPASDTVGITNGSGGSIPLTGLSVGTVSYGGGASGWLATPTLNSTVDPASLTLQPQTGALAPGTYTATVPILSAVASNSPQNVTVTFDVTPLPPTIALDPPARTFTALENGANPASDTVGITNGSGGSVPLTGLSVGPVNYQSGTPGWLGTPTLSSTVEPASLTLQPQTGSLSAGTYTATVPILSTVASNSPQNVTVTFDVSPRPDIVLSANSVTFQQADANGAPPQDEVVNITRGGSGSWPLTGLNVAQITYTGGGATGWLSASLSATDAPSDLTLSVSTTGLTAGTTYTATVDIESPVAGNSPQQISVSFTTN